MEEEREEKTRRRRRKEAYHLVAGKSKLPSDPNDLQDDYLYTTLTVWQPSTRPAQQRLKQDLLQELAISGGDVTTPRFIEILDQLTNLYKPSHFDARIKTRRDNLRSHLGGMWINLSKPNFPGCIGKNEDNEYMYTLGHMSFDMFRPTHLVCSIQGAFNPVHYVGTRDRESLRHVPRRLEEEIKRGNSLLRTHNIVTAFTIEPSKTTRDTPNSPNRSAQRPIKALMTTYGYSLPDPKMPNRLSTWFTGGTIEVWDDVSDMRAWKSVFESLEERSLKQKARLFSARLAVGASPAGEMEADGKMSYSMSRPVGGHGVAYVDVVYLDETLRIFRGNYGTVYVNARIPFPDE